MSTEKNEILEFNQYMKSDKISYIIYADIESLIRKIEGCANKPENSSEIKIGEHIPSGYSMPAIWEFGHIENKHALDCGKDCIKRFYDFLREHAKNIIDFEKKKMLPLTKKEVKSHEDAKVCYTCRKRILKNTKDINYQKVRDHFH